MASTFPQFSDGDVEIWLTTEPKDKIVIHSYVLALHSPWFKASLSERWKGNNSSIFGEGKKVWVYELHFDKNTEFAMLARRGVSDGTHGIIFYHLPLQYSDDESPNKAKASVLLLANIADMYGCVDLVSIHAETHLRPYTSCVEDMCARDPVDMLKFSSTIRSEWIFRDAATNLIGRSHTTYTKAIPDLQNLGIREASDKSRSHLVNALRLFECEMLRLQPEDTNGYEGFMAIGFFRQWLSEQLQAGQGSALSSGYAKVYRTIAKGNFCASVSGKAAVLDYMARFYSNPETTVNECQPFIDRVFARGAKLLFPVFIMGSANGRYGNHNDRKPLRFTGVSRDELPWLRLLLDQADAEECH